RFYLVPETSSAAFPCSELWNPGMMHGASQQSVPTSVVPFSNFTFLQRRERPCNRQEARAPRMRSSSCPAKFTSSESTPFKATSASSIDTQLSYAHQESTVHLIPLLHAGQ